MGLQFQSCMALTWIPQVLSRADIKAYLVRVRVRVQVRADTKAYLSHQYSTLT